MRCKACGAEIIYGDPHEMRVTEHGITRVEIRCQSCADDYAWWLWPEDWGPFPHQRHRAGNT
jgi:RNase P subunit RPR2